MTVPSADLALTGAKLGCGEGGCGACTVLVSSADLTTGALHHRSINACLCPLYAVRALCYAPGWVAWLLLPVCRWPLDRQGCHSQLQRLHSGLSSAPQLPRTLRLLQVEGMHVITVEGIGNTRDGLHPVQVRAAANPASRLLPLHL